MFTDTVVLASVITIVAVCVVLFYLGRFTVNHIKEDIKKHPEAAKK